MDNLPIYPPGHMILVEVEVEVISGKTESGLYVARKNYKGEFVSYDETQEIDQAEKGIVRALGPTAYEAVRPPFKWCSVGDEVYFETRVGKPLKFGDRHFRVINDDDIRGIVNPHYIPTEEPENDKQK